MRLAYQLWRNRRVKIYVASSWRNNAQPEVVAALRDDGHEVYDFKQPQPGDNGFHWSEIDGGWETWGPEEFAQHLNDPVAESGFRKDMSALDWCDACVLVMPCGRSAHLELGYAIGANKKTIILLSSGEPELMYKMVDYLAITLADVLIELRHSCTADNPHPSCSYNDPENWTCNA